MVDEDRTWIDLVLDVAEQHEGWSDHQFTPDEIDFILWECTAFPMAGLDKTTEQLQNLFTRRTPKQVHEMQKAGISGMCDHMDWPGLCRKCDEQLDIELHYSELDELADLHMWEEPDE